MVEYYVDLYGMIDLEGIKEEDDEESGSLIKFMRVWNIRTTKIVGMGFGDHRFICKDQKKLAALAIIWYKLSWDDIPIKDKGILNMGYIKKDKRKTIAQKIKINKPKVNTYVEEDIIPHICSKIGNYIQGCVRDEEEDPEYIRYMVMEIGRQLRNYYNVEYGIFSKEKKNG